MITLKDIAMVCGVSVATVSRALNGSGDISPAQTEKIRRTARQMGYVPNAAARALKTNRSYMLGILYEDRMDHEYFSLVIEALRRHAEDQGYDLTFLSRNMGDGPADYPERAARRNLDGVVIVQARWGDQSIQRLLTGQLPCVTIDYYQQGCEAVLNDNRVSMRALVREACSRGYRQLAFIHGEDGFVTSERLEGFRQGLEECGLEKNAAYVRPAQFRNPDASYEAARRLMQLRRPPDCIFFPDDYSLMGVADRLRQKGKCLPDIFGAVGYDGIGPSGYFSPRLFTYRQDTETIGKTAVDKLLARVTGHREEEPGASVIPGGMIRGDTLPQKPSSR